MKKKKFGIRKEPVVRIWIPKNKKVKSILEKRKLLLPIIEGEIKPGVFVVDEEPVKKRKSYKEIQKEKKAQKEEVIKKLSEKDAKKNNVCISVRLTKETSDKKIKAVFKIVSKKYVENKKKLKKKKQNKRIKSWRLKWKKSITKRNVHILNTQQRGKIVELDLKKKDKSEIKLKKKWPIEWLRLARAHKISKRLEKERKKNNKALILYDPKITDSLIEMPKPPKPRYVLKKAKIFIKTRSQVLKKLTKELNKKFNNKFKKRKGKKKIIKRHKIKFVKSTVKAHKKITNNSLRNLRKYIALNVRTKSTRSVSFMTWHIIQNDLVLKKLYSFLVKKGKKYLALKIVKNIFIKLKELTGLNPLIFIHNYFYSVKNILKLRVALSKKKKKKIRVPSFLSNKKQLFYTFKKLIKYANEKKNNRYRETDVDSNKIVDEEESLLADIKEIKNYTFMSFTDRIVYILLMFATGNSRKVFKKEQYKLNRLCYESKFLLKKKYDKKRFIGINYGFLRMKKKF